MQLAGEQHIRTPKIFRFTRNDLRIDKAPE